MAAGVELLPGAFTIMGTSLGATIDEQMHEGSPELGLALQDFVRELTPIRTGALIQDIAYEAFPDPGDSELVYVYAETRAQEAYWNRVYVQYQEGGALGEPTYTNEPHEMFYETSIGAGLDFTQSWAEGRVQLAIDLWVSGAGVPF